MTGNEKFAIEGVKVTEAATVSDKIKRS